MFLSCLVQVPGQLRVHPEKFGVGGGKTVELSLRSYHSEECFLVAWCRCLVSCGCTRRGLCGRREDGGAVTAKLSFQRMFLNRLVQVPGQLRVHPEGFVWRKLGGGRRWSWSKADVSTLTWLQLPTGFQLTVRHRTGNKTKFLGFKRDVSATHAQPSPLQTAQV